jgi:isoaspartyl peptidase/L-asparaginase-like protein (Ntn-hydrolase superfamily)
MMTDLEALQIVQTAALSELMNCMELHAKGHDELEAKVKNLNSATDRVGALLVRCQQGDPVDKAVQVLKQHGHVSFMGESVQSFRAFYLDTHPLPEAVTDAQIAEALVYVTDNCELPDVVFHKHMAVKDAWRELVHQVLRAILVAEKNKAKA